MRRNFCFIIAFTIFNSLTLPVLAEEASGSPALAPPAQAVQPDPFDFAPAGRSESGQENYLDLDERIKVSVDPVVHSAVVDRVMEPGTVYVKAPACRRVEVYLEPVDSPYCGKSLADPKLIGFSTDAAHNFPVSWNSPETNRYVKIYAIAYRRDGQVARSRSLDISLAGSRLQAAP